MTQIKKYETVKQNLLQLLIGKKVLFLENDDGLYHGLDKLEKFLIKNKIEYSCLFDLSTFEFDYIVKKIFEHDVIVFQTQWVYKISHQLKEFAYGMQVKKIFIECYLGDPTWYHKPNVIHDVYILRSYESTDWKFYKLSAKPYWEYKNKFDR
jgi:hypothetical protein